MTETTPSLSTQPYLIRALHEWCVDNGFTPYLAVAVDETVRVPREYVQDGQIVLNVSFDATGGLHLGNEYIEFKSRFSGAVRDITVPVNRVMAIYAKENGQGMAFALPEAADDTLDTVDGADQVEVVDAIAPPVTPPPPSRPAGGRPTLTRIK